MWRHNTWDEHNYFLHQSVHKVKGSQCIDLLAGASSSLQTAPLVRRDTLSWTHTSNRLHRVHPYQFCEASATMRSTCEMVPHEWIDSSRPIHCKSASFSKSAWYLQLSLAAIPSSAFVCELQEGPGIWHRHRLASASSASESAWTAEDINTCSDKETPYGYILKHALSRRTWRSNISMLHPQTQHVMWWGRQRT